MPSEIDWILTESLLVGASHALGDIAAELSALREDWVALDVEPEPLAWLERIIAEAGWWSGRLAAGAVHE